MSKILFERGLSIFNIPLSHFLNNISPSQLNPAKFGWCLEYLRTLLVEFIFNPLFGQLKLCKSIGKSMSSSWLIDVEHSWGRLMVHSVSMTDFLFAVGTHVCKLNLTIEIFGQMLNWKSLHVWFELIWVDKGNEPWLLSYKFTSLIIDNSAIVIIFANMDKLFTLGNDFREHIIDISIPTFFKSISLATCRLIPQFLSFCDYFLALWHVVILLIPLLDFSIWISYGWAHTQEGNQSSRK